MTIRSFFMRMREHVHPTFLTGTSWLWLIALLCLSGRCMGQAYDGFGYSVSGTNITIASYTGPPWAITIPSLIPGVNGTVTSIGDRALYERALTSVLIPSNVTSIGFEAFFGCRGLTNVTLGNGLAAIGDDTFAECSGLTSVLIPSNVTSIGFEVFFGCSDLASVTIPDSVTNIGSAAFENCPGLTNVTIPSSVTSIGVDAFGGSGLITVTIPGSVTSIGDGAFGGCTRLTSVAIPSNATFIGNLEFANCSGLTSVIIPSGVTSIGDYALGWCSGLTGAYFQGNAPPALGVGVFYGTAPGFSIYYPSTATGWSTPTWNGYPAQPYPLLSLTLGSGAVTPAFSYLHPATNYQLQVSADLNTWSNTGPVFAATNASEAYAQPFNVSNWNRLFFRLVSAP